MTDNTDVLDDIDDDGEAASAETFANPTSILSGKRIALAGRFGSMNRREAANLLRSYDASIVELDAIELDWIIIGAEESPLAEEELLPETTLELAGRGEVTVIHEADLWQQIGLVDADHIAQQYYTPSMLARILDVKVHVVRRWHRRGLITPVRTMHKLPYFDFREVATAKRLAQWVASGASPKAIEQRLVDLVEILPDLQRPLDQLSILIEGKQVLLRQGEGLIEPGGQLRFDFAALDNDNQSSADPTDEQLANDFVFSIEQIREKEDLRRDRRANDDLLNAAFEAEDEDDLDTAIDYCHAILARDGPRADVSFQIGELLYRMNQPIAARERYYVAIELDPEFVEARASLAAVLSETGQFELAVAAYRGVLQLHPDYPDVHFHLARLLSELHRDIEAAEHWRRFLRIAPDSPWANEAKARLNEIVE